MSEVFPNLCVCNWSMHTYQLLDRQCCIQFFVIDTFYSKNNPTWHFVCKKETFSNFTFNFNFQFPFQILHFFFPLLSMFSFSFHSLYFLLFFSQNCKDKKEERQEKRKEKKRKEKKRKDKIR